MAQEPKRTPLTALNRRTIGAVTQEDDGTYVFKTGNGRVLCMVSYGHLFDGDGNRFADEDGSPV